MEANSFPIFQKTFSCLQCFGIKFFYEHALCSFCLKECHYGHNTFYLGEKTSLCSCYLAGGCRNTFEEDVCSNKILEGDKLQTIY